jgi:hypothetical protein
VAPKQATVQPAQGEPSITKGKKVPKNASVQPARDEPPIAEGRGKNMAAKKVTNSTQPTISKPKAKAMAKTPADNRTRLSQDRAKQNSKETGNVHDADMSPSTQSTQSQDETIQTWRNGVPSPNWLGKCRLFLHRMPFTRLNSDFAF